MNITNIFKPMTNSLFFRKVGLVSLVMAASGFDGKLGRVANRRDIIYDKTGASEAP